MTTALTIVDTSSYAVAELAASDQLDTYFDQLGVDQLGWNSFPSIRVPSGTGSAFDVQDGDPVRSFKGIILHAQPTRAYWVSTDPKPGVQPDCSAVDAKTGRGIYGPGTDGNPSGSCFSCPMAQDGSGKDGIGQACKARRLVFVLTQNDYLPSVLSVPAASLYALDKYLLSFKFKKPLTPFYGAETEFSLEPATSKGGIAYKKIKFSRVGNLSPEMTETMAEYSVALLSRLGTFTFDPGEQAV